MNETNAQQLPPYIQQYIDLQEQQLQNERLVRMGLENKNAQISAFPPLKEQNLIEYQLDLKEEIDRIYHLLSGHVLTLDSEGGEDWIEPDDDRLKIFSDYGVKQIMNIISFYINRNTLLSNYDIDTITWKVRDFGIELADLIFSRYELFFHYPSPEDLYEKYIELIKSHKLNISENELYWKCVQWSKEEMQYKIRHYPIIVLSLIDVVHSTYLRALRGEERTSLRKFMHVSQNTQPDMNMQSYQNKKQFRILRPSTWTG